MGALLHTSGNKIEELLIKYPEFKKTITEEVEKRMKILLQTVKENIFDSQPNENDWSPVYSLKKKRNSPTDNERKTRQKLITEYKLNSENRFQLLSSESDQNQHTTEPTSAVDAQQEQP